MGITGAAGYVRVDKGTDNDGRPWEFGTLDADAMLTTGPTATSLRLSGGKLDHFLAAGALAKAAAEREAEASRD